MNVLDEAQGGATMRFVGAGCETISTAFPWSRERDGNVAHQIDRYKWYGTCTVLQPLVKNPLTCRSDESACAAPGGFRFPLVWPIYLWRRGDTVPLAGRTLNLSAGAFYCVAPQQVARGSRLRCDILIPSRRDSLALKCDIYVISSGATSKFAEYGMDCLIESYSVVRWTARAPIISAGHRSALARPSIDGEQCPPEWRAGRSPEPGEILEQKPK